MSGKNLKIGLALGSGAARGMAHIPILEVLEDEGIRIDMIAGTSIGSLIGGVYAAGVPVKYIKELAKELNWDHITDVTFPRKGLIKGEKLLSFLELVTQGKKIEDLKIPFCAIACDIEKGEHVVLDKGSLARAIRASTSIPGIYVPFRHQNRILVDGAVLDPIPISTLKEMGADIVIAVDVSIKNLHYEAENIFHILFNTFDIIQNQLEKYKTFEADVVIKPDLINCNSFDLDSHEECFFAGREAIYQALARIKEKIKEKS
ncbi:MAG: patatin-like phospholipase family protein [Halanaerobiaceae bacterium]